jgi:hypothetical protein
MAMLKRTWPISSLTVSCFLLLLKYTALVQLVTAAKQKML